MKKIIFKNFLRETTIFFLLSCSSVALIVWVIQAVNYLGFVTEDGHGFKIYFMYISGRLAQWESNGFACHRSSVQIR